MKVIIWSWVVLFGIVGGLFYSAYTKLNPQSFVSLLNEQAQKSYPGSNLSIGAVDYHFSIDFSINLKDVKLVRSNQVLGEIKDIELKIPWWVILFNRGSAQINVSTLSIYVVSEKVLPESLDDGPEPINTPKINEKIELSVPDYLMDAHYTLRAKNVSVKEMDGGRTYIMASKLLVREFQYGKNSAFEVNIPISITHKEKSYTSELWLFGDVTPELKSWSLNYRGEIKTKDASDGFEFDDLVIDGKASFDPARMNLKSRIDLLVERKKIGDGSVTAKYNKLDLDLHFTAFPLEYLALVGEEIKNPFWLKTKGVGEGEFRLSRSHGAENGAKFSGRINFPGEFALGPKIKVEGKWLLNFENTKLETSFITPKGEVSFFRRAVMNFDQGAITQYSQEIGFVDFDLASCLLPVEGLSQYMHNDQTTYHSTLISLKKCREGEKVIEGQFRYGVSPYEKFYQAELNEEGTKAIINYQSKASDRQLNIEFNKFSWRPTFQFLAPYFTAGAGKLDGKIQGKWEEKWMDGKWLMTLKAEGLKDPSGEFLDFNQLLWKQYDIDAAGVDSRSWNASALKGNVKLVTLALESADPAQLSGNLSTSLKQKSNLSLSYPKNKKWKAVKKDILEPFWIKETP